MQVVHDDVELHPDARLGSFVVLHPGTRVGPGCVIQDHAVIGKPPLRMRGSRAPELDAAEATILGAGVQVGSSAVIAAGATIGDNALIGDACMLRERVVIEADAMISSHVVLGHGVIVRRGARIRNFVALAPGTVVGEDAFLGIGIGAVSTNRPAVDEPMRGVEFGARCRVGSNATLLPGVRIGADAVVGAGSVVTRDVPDGATAIGVPARVR